MICLIINAHFYSEIGVKTKLDLVIPKNDALIMYIYICTVPD